MSISYSFKSLSRHSQSTLELVIAMAIFSLISAVMISLALGGFNALGQGGEQTQAEALAQEGVEAVRSIRGRGWNEFIYNQSGVEINEGKWIFSGEGTAEKIDQYTRTITFENVCRNILDEITACPGLYSDLHSKKVTVTVTWEVRPGIINSVQKITYLTNWDSQEWIQTNWVGGPGQDIWSDQTKYNSDDNNIDYSVMGEIRLAKARDGSWILAGGEQFRDITDVDFNAGEEFNNTVVVGTGEDAGVFLEQDTLWTEHNDSQSATTNEITDITYLSADDIWASAGGGEILHYNGSNWTEFTDLGSDDINGLEMISANDGWAVGESAKIYRYNGFNWTQLYNFSNDLFGIDMVYSDNGWAVGDSGKIYKYNGVNWSQFADTGGEIWRAVAMITANDGWAVGDKGNIAQYNGTFWVELDEISSQDLNDIDMVFPNDGWIVGDSGKFFHYNGWMWSEFADLGSNDINVVQMLSSNDGWAAGESGKIYHYNGTSWSEFVDNGGMDWRAICFSSVDSGWVMGDDGRIYQYGDFYPESGVFFSRIFNSEEINTRWEMIYWTEVLPAGSDLTIATRTGNTPIPDGSWSSFSGELTDPESSYISSPSRQYLQYRATLTKGDSGLETPELADVTIVYNTPTDKNLNGIDVVSSSDIWAVGNSGEILHYDGNDWSEFIDLGEQDLYAVEMTAADDGWAGGESGKFFHYNGSAWSEFVDLGWRDINVIYMLSSDNGWAAGESGKIYHYNGVDWTEFADTGEMNWRGLDVVSDSDGWLVGNDGKIYHYNGTDWNQFVDTGSQVWNSVFMLEAGDGWLVGDSGRIYRYNGTNWTQFIDTGSTNWRSVYFITADDGWAMGSSGEIYRWLDGGWADFSSPTNRNLNSVGMISEIDGWTVGNNGTIIHFTREALFVQNGYLISSAFNMGDISPVQIIDWGENIPACSLSCQIKLQIRVAPDSGGSPSPWTNWFGVDGPGSYFTNADGSLISSDLNDNQWLQYRVELIGDGLDTPILEEVRINYK